MLRLIIFLVFIWRHKAQASLGDQSDIFNYCLDKCFERNCTQRLAKNDHKTSYELTQPFYLKLLGWDCESECKYVCMWKTVRDFKVYYKEEAPQFYGKWPFVRILGIQEPASAIGSLFNFMANYFMIKKMRKKMPKNSPFKQLWYFFGFICLNTWFWSAVFHTRDTPFTERMDYFSAFLLVLTQFNTFFVRFWKLDNKNNSLMYLINSISILFYVYHCNYLSSVHFDYGYNMSMNILVGLLNSFFWLAWCAWRYFKENVKYVWKCAFSIILFDVLIVFEVFDFRPLWWSIDSHAMWHLSTIVLPYFWYNFIIDDCIYLSRSNYQKFI
ncbi:unnamed protein product [Brachionus calyciflorus]|uniref:Post-GPI attachment to proteins factor 3 n=1 Tax=Brachionus calyciflorus TaxID=104777 RepID=A0A813Y8K4_9BILA|nr:unnamed protein product [Brachionus calyciflorus]